MPRVVIENLTRVFAGPRQQQVTAVCEANLTVEDKELLVLVGPSGCGKTTTLRLIAGLDEPTSGAISVDGRPMNGIAPKDRHIAMVFQNHALYPHMTALENMAFGLRIRRFSRKEIEERVSEAADLLGLKDCLDRRPPALSGGQRQRVALGRAIVRRPKVFLLDEPLSNLDAPLRAQMRSEIARLHSRLGATIIYVTHDQTEAMALGDRIAVMADGKIHQVAQPMTAYREPADLFVAGFLGSPAMNLFEGVLARKEQGTFFVAGGGNGSNVSRSYDFRLDDAVAHGMAEYIGRPVIVGLRPEHISYKSAALESEDSRIKTATVEAIERLGADTYLRLAGSGSSFISRTPAPAAMRPGKQVVLELAHRHAVFFDPKTRKAIQQGAGAT